MWFSRRWPTLVGFLTWLWPAWHGLKQIVGFGGDVDFIISRSQEPAWIGFMLNLLLNPPGWLLLGLIAAGVVLIIYDARRNRSREPDWNAEAAPRARAMLAAKTVDVAPPKPSQSNARATVVPQMRDSDWLKLYAVADESRTVQLRFLPDNTHTQKADTLLLVVLGQKVLLGADQVAVRGANAEVHRAMHKAPNSPVPGIMRETAFAAFVARGFAEPPEPDQGHVEAGMLMRTGLSTGGFYQLTPEGDAHARALAADLIRRA